jgi:prepilin-type N-terminal cleavage/methylation domain-containing protein/prepilin-type processing-associated H-X9-DG protein
MKHAVKIIEGVCFGTIPETFPQANPRKPAAHDLGFTLVELLVVIAITGILAALLFPVLSRGKQKAQQVYCLSNGRQMMTAITVYVGDSTDFFPPNPDDGNIIPGHNWCSGNAGVGDPQEFNPDVLKDPTRSLLAPYLQGNTGVFHCPGDKRMGVYQGSDPAMMGKIIPAARTFSMNQALGTICPEFDQTRYTGWANSKHAGAPTLSVNGICLNNQKTHHRNSPWLTYGKLASIHDPGPAMLWVLVDEDINGLNDAAFAFGMDAPFWFDAPGTYHNGGCGFAFADGHSESHRWASTAPKKANSSLANPQDYQDWLWMRVRTSANISGVMPSSQ